MTTVQLWGLVLIACVLSAPVQGDSGRSEVLAPGYRALHFPAPAPGSYRLPALGRATDGSILNSQGEALSLHQLMGDKIVLLSFIYSTCGDVNGCPLATAVFHKIKRQLAKAPEMSQQLRLLTLSFNPQYDTPEKMQQYSQGFQGQGIDWQFLTTRSDDQLTPILDGYGQSVTKNYDQQGLFTGTFSHQLRVFLIDRTKRIRNIYSVAFLHPETVINDVKTVLSAVTKESEHFGSLLKREALWRQTRLQTFTDNEKIPFQQDSDALIDGMRQPFDLLSTVKQPPLGLPAIPVPANNPLTKDKVQLGRKLFYDRRLSLNNTFSCAMCHIPEQGFTNNQLKTAVGFEGRTVRRNAPSLFNVAFNATLFHDGRETSLENQVWGPLLAANEMANPSIGYVIEKIKASADYAGLFQRAFKRGVSMETVAMAIASYERTLNAADSRFDRWFFNDQKDALAPLAQQGYRLFVGKARCASCHTLTNQAALFTDEQWHNTGLGYQEAHGLKPSQQQVQLAPGQFVTVDSTLIATVSEPKVSDLGRYEVTQDPKDKWRYRTPSLRNISLTAPYMHKGQFSTLQQVVNFYDQGGIENPDLDPLIVPLHLTEQEKTALVHFLEALTGSTVASLVLDGISAPVTDAQ